jgi:Acetyltransferase (GNAT) domain
MSGAFAVWDAADESGAGAWDARWKSWPEQEVWAHPAYASLYAGPAARALCAAWESEEGCVLYPLLLRDLSAEPWWRPELGPATDVATPYGYGGPFFWGSDREGVASRFWTAFDAWASEVGAVSEFARLGLFPEQLLPYPGETEERLQNVVRDLEPDQEALWMDVEHKVRKNVQKARRSGVSVEVDLEGRRLEEFVDLYHRTMERRRAREAYFFPAEFFEEIVRGLPGQFAFFHAFHEGALVSTELLLRSAENIYSFLGGTDERAYSVRPNDVLKWEIVLWAKEQGKRRYVLGGGLEPEDAIFRYKLAVAPSGRVPFLVGRRVLQPESYERLVRVRTEDPAWSPQPGFFPAYRA